VRYSFPVAQLGDHVKVSRKVLRLGTRGSALAMAQSRIVANYLTDRHPSLRVELVAIRTTGDVVADRPLHEFGGKGVFTKEIELALLRGEIDCAVHSLKDMPVTQPLVEQGELMIAAILEREDVRDVLVSRVARTINELPQNARVGSSSLRRRAQLLDRRPDLQVEPLRGNIDTRISKLKAGGFDAIVLAAAGISRLGVWDDALMTSIDLFQMLPAAGQGALAVQGRCADDVTRAFLAPLDHSPSRRAVEIERRLILELRGDCHSPLAVYVTDDRFEAAAKPFHLQAAVARRGGVPPLISVKMSGGAEIALDAARRLEDQGAIEMLHGPQC